MRSNRGSGSSAKKDTDSSSVGRIVLVACVVIVSVLTEYSFAQTATSEYNLKSAYLYSFANYTTWPWSESKSKTDVVVGVYGESPIYERLTQVALKRRIKGRSLRLIQFAGDSDSPSFDQCDIVFMSASIPVDQQQRVIDSLSESPILLMGEIPQFTAMGGAVGFRLQETTVKFDVNVEASRRSNLVLNAKLLRLASTPPKGEPAFQTQTLP